MSASRIETVGTEQSLDSQRETALLSRFEGSVILAYQWLADSNNWTKGLRLKNPLREKTGKGTAEFNQADTYLLFQVVLSNINKALPYPLSAQDLFALCKRFNKYNSTSKMREAEYTSLLNIVNKQLERPDSSVIDMLSILGQDAKVSLFIQHNLFKEGNWKSFTPQMAKDLIGGFTKENYQEILKNPDLDKAKLLYLFAGEHQQLIGEYISRHGKTEEARWLLSELGTGSYWNLNSEVAYERQAEQLSSASFGLAYCPADQVGALVDPVKMSSGLRAQLAVFELIKTGLLDPTKERYDFSIDPNEFKKNTLVLFGLSGLWNRFVRNMDQGIFDFIFKEDSLIDYLIAHSHGDEWLKNKLTFAIKTATEKDLLSARQLLDFIKRKPAVASMVLEHALPEFLRYTKHFDEESVKDILELIGEAKKDPQFKPFLKKDGVVSNARDDWRKKFSNFFWMRGELHPLIKGIYNNTNGEQKRKFWQVVADWVRNPKVSTNPDKWRVIGPLICSDDALTDAFFAQAAPFKKLTPLTIAAIVGAVGVAMASIPWVIENTVPFARLVMRKLMQLPWDVARKKGQLGSYIGSGIVAGLAFVAKIFGIAAVSSATLAVGMASGAAIGFAIGAVSAWMGFWVVKYARKGWNYMWGTDKVNKENYLIIRNAFEYGNVDAFKAKILNPEKPQLKEQFVRMVLQLKREGYNFNFIGKDLNRLVRESYWEDLRDSSRIGQIQYHLAHKLGALVGWPGFLFGYEVDRAKRLKREQAKLGGTSSVVICINEAANSEVRESSQSQGQGSIPLDRASLNGGVDHTMNGKHNTLAVESPEHRPSAQALAQPS